jgi:hypothetical protein
MKNVHTLLFFFLLPCAKAFCVGSLFLCFIGLSYTHAQAPAPAPDTLSVLPLADAFVRNGSFANINYGFDTALQVKGTTSVNAVRDLYLKFPLSKVSNIDGARLRLYGRNIENAASVTLSVFGVDNDAWTESGITWNNAPATQPVFAGTFGVGAEGRYYEVDITSLAREELAKDKMLSLLIRDTARQNSQLAFNSREQVLYKPELVITPSALLPVSGAKLFIENLDRFPSNDDFMASRIQVPWSRNRVVYNTNHDTVRVRLHNKGIHPLVISNIVLSNKADWTIETLNGATYDSATALPLSINPGLYADMQLKFTAVEANPIRVKLLVNELLIVSNDDRQPYKTLYLRGLWQREGEGSKEPTAQEMINAFGFRTRVGFNSTDPDRGTNGKPKGDEVLTSYFVRADTAQPVTIRQMGAYHGCCTVQPDSISWYLKENTAALINATKHLAEDAQRLLPRSIRSTSYTPAEALFYPAGPFGFKVGTFDWSDTLLTPQQKIGIRVWKAIDASGLVIPGAYIIANDYLGTSSTNYDYNDNMYFVTNIRPEHGPAAVSSLASMPSSGDFGERLLQSDSAFTLNLQSLGQRYPGGVQDPAVLITAVVIVGENKNEFAAVLPDKTVLNAQESTTLTVAFHPQSEGLKIADLLIYYNNAGSPLRVPLYGIGKAEETTVSVPYRIKSGAATDVVVGGKTWVADVPFAFDNLQPFVNAQLTQISATDDDVLYLRQQSSDGEKKPFRYEMPLQNGSYWVRLHFAEAYWGTPASGLNGGTGSRVMNVDLEDELKLINLDVSQEVGKTSAVVKNIPVTVNDGKLNINFSASAGSPLVAAVEVYQFRNNVIVPPTNPPVGNNGNLKVYPNPVQQKLTIGFPDGYNGTIHLQLLDASGRVYYQGKEQARPTNFTTELDLANLVLARGVYFLRIFSAEGKTEVVKLFMR